MIGCLCSNDLGLCITASLLHGELEIKFLLNIEFAVANF